MSSTYIIDWVGDKTHDYKDKRTYSVAVKDAEGNDHRKVKLELDQSAPAPAVGDSVEGALKPHPRFDDAKLFVVNGDTSTSTATSGAYSADQQERMNRANAVNNGTALVAAQIRAGTIKDDDAAIAALSSFAKQIFDVLTKPAESEGKASAPKTDDDIPF